jgi:hypothetical protein
MIKNEVNITYSLVSLGKHGPIFYKLIIIIIIIIVKKLIQG